MVMSVGRLLAAAALRKLQGCPLSALSFGHPHCEYIRQFRSGGEGATRGGERVDSSDWMREGRERGKGLRTGHSRLLLSVDSRCIMKGV